MIKEKVFNPKLAPDPQIILDATTDQIVAFDKDYQLAYCNQSFKKNFEMFAKEPLDENKPLDTYLGLSRFIELKSNWEGWINRAFSGEQFKDKIEYKIIGKKLFYTLEFKPVIKKNEVIYVQISAREETLRKNYEDLVKWKKDVEECTDCVSEDIQDKEQIKQERDEALKLLLENAERLQMVFEGSNDGFWDWNIENDEIFHSKQYYEILGYRQGQIKTDLKTWQDRIHKSDVDSVLEELHKHLEGKTDQFISEYRIKTKNGSWKWVLDKGKVAIRDENNNPLRIAGTLSDIDERKKTEKELRESETRFVSMAENLPVMVWLTDNKIKPKFANKKAIDFLGNLDENKAIHEYIHSDDLDYFKYNLITAIKTKKTLTCELRILKDDLEYRWILTNIVPRFSEKDQLIGVLGVGLDITERKDIETKLLESETQFTEITSVIGDGIFMIDSNFLLKFANPEFSNLLGYGEEELEGINIHDIIHSHGEDQNSDCPIYDVLKNGQKRRVPEDYFKTKSDLILPVSYVVSPLKRNDSIVGCVVAFHDITERMQYEDEMKRFVEELQYNKELMEENANEFAILNEELAESQSRLQELNASKDKFFSIISHDLRSPFTSIIGFAEVMLEDLDTLGKDDIKEFTSSIFKSSKNIQNLLENLLQWSRVQTGRIEFNPINFDLNHLANDVVALYQVNAARKKITLTNAIENDLQINADKFMIDTLLRNLVSNSIKFTSQGGEIKIFAEEIPDEKMLQISIEDTGVGMTDQILSKLFKIDEHVTTKGTEKEKGTGLGLILCKEFIEKHGGKIWAESTLGE
ncbi:MAG: PAS domain S-box protein, partial [Melioribacteraceae bacterium]|nr:PAS domain S-box protein [Melioribacteraceae bacterium]